MHKIHIKAYAIILFVADPDYPRCDLQNYIKCVLPVTCK